MFWKPKITKPQVKSSLIFCQTRREVFEVLQHSVSIFLPLAISRSERLYKNSNGDLSGELFGVVHQQHTYGQPFLPMCVKFEDEAKKYADEVEHNITNPDGVCRISVDGSSVEKDSGFFYKLNIYVKDRDLEIFEKIEKCMALSANSGGQFYHIYLQAFNNYGDRQNNRATINKQMYDLKSWTENSNEPDFFDFDLAFNHITFCGSARMNSPRWAHEWSEEPLNQPHFHNKKTAIWRRFAGSGR